MNRKAFTLIELLIVVTIIGILAVALVPRIIGGSAAARDARRQTDIQTLATGLEYYLSENGHFNAIEDDVGNTVCASDLSTYLSGSIGSIPSDPSDQENDAFGLACTGDYAVLLMAESVGGDFTKYAIAARMELPEVGDDFMYNEPGAADVYTDFSPVDFVAGNDGYFVVY